MRLLQFTGRMPLDSLQRTGYIASRCVDPWAWLSKPRTVARIATSSSSPFRLIRDWIMDYIFLRVLY